jgi:hypothetical protein
MDRLGTTGREPGSLNDIQRFNSISTYKQIKASIVSVLMWLSAIGVTL